MTDHPILFNGDMVRAIRDGHKTQTRRIIKRLPIHADYGEPDWNKTWIDDSYDPPCLKVAYGGGKMGPTAQRHFSKYTPGDLLWVREKWRPLYRMHTNVLVGACFRWRGGGRVFNAEHKGSDNIDDLTPFKPSIHMPKWACRNWLKVKSVRVERLREISDKDIICEGFECREDFYSAIIKINKAKNPEEYLNKWCWAINFGKSQKNG